MKCTNCGAEVGENAKFCPECGQKIERKKFCPKCGTEIKGGRFCPECGAPLTEEKSQAVSNSDKYNILEDLEEGFGNSEVQKNEGEAKAAEYNKKIKAASAYVIMEKYDEAKEIYDELVKDNPEDMDIYMGYVRIATKNYTKYADEEIEKSIRDAKKISGKEDLSQFDPDYAPYGLSRKNYLAEKAKEERRRHLIDEGPGISSEMYRRKIKELRKAEEVQNEVVEEKTYKIVLKDYGMKKITIIDIVRSFTGLGLVDAKRLVEKGGVLSGNLTKADAEKIAAKLKAAGAKVVLE